MKTTLKLLLFMYWLACPVHSLAFIDIDFKKITVQDGLSDNKVNCIFKDRNGIMWFGTDYGVSRYDGVNLNNFSIPNSFNHVSSIVQLNDTYLVVNIDNALYVFNMIMEKFFPLHLTFKCEGVKGIIPKSDDECWLIAENRFYLCEIHLHSYAQDKTDYVYMSYIETHIIFPDAGESFTCYSLSENNDTIYFTDNKSNLLAFDLASKRLAYRVYIENLPDDVKYILRFGDYIWIGTVACGIIRYEESTGMVERFSYDDGDRRYLSHTDSYGMIPINKRQLLTVTWNGYTILSAEDDTFHKFSTSIYDNVALSGQNIETRMICVYYDSQGALWIGTHGGGILYSDLPFQNISRYMQDRHNEICAITADCEGYIWLATFHKGIMKSDKPFVSTDDLSFFHVKGLTDCTTVLCIYNDRDSGKILFGTNEGEICEYDCYSKSGRNLRLKVAGEHIGVPVKSLMKDSRGQLWIGTTKGLLSLKNTADGECIRIAVKNTSVSADMVSVNTLVESADGEIWVGTMHNGLGKISQDTCLILGYGENYNMGNVSVRSILAASDGRLYVGYADGFAVTDASDGNILEFYTTQNGLCNNFIGCIIEDEDHHIWLGSNSCISRFSRKHGLFFHYYISGNNKSVFRMDSILLWGNNKSLTYFDSRSLDRNTDASKVAIVSLTVGNKAVRIGELINGQTVLEKALTYTDGIFLNSKNKDFSLRFNALNYSTAGSKVRYRLYPFQKDWLTVDKGGQASYNSLKAGKYIFETECIYPDESTGPTGQLNIEIIPHWTETTAFTVGISLIILLSLYFIARIIYGIGQRKLLEVKLEQEVFIANSEREREKEMRMERENFFRNTSHELRTPLTLIISPLEEILNEMDKKSPYRERLESIKRSARSLHSLVDRLLYLSKTEVGLVKLQVTKVDIAKLAREVGSEFSLLAESGHIVYKSDIPNISYVIWVDAEKVTFAIRNLLTNAFKNTPQGGEVLLSVGTETIDGVDNCKISVSDTGKGIPPELQNKVFSPYFTANDNPFFSSGMGIGLYIVKSTVELHHGMVRLDSDIGKGSTFTILLPEGCSHLSKEEMDNTEQLHEEDVLPDEKNDIYRILIIEDNTEVRRYICSIFEKDYVVLEAGNGEDGIEVALKHKPSLIISDIMMPVMDGLTCCKKIREDVRTAHIPVLMLTAREEEISILKADRMGADDYIVKPFNPILLRSKVKNLIAQRQRLKRIYSRIVLAKEGNDGDKTDDEFLQRAMRVIEANIANKDFNVKMLAGLLNVSQPTLYRKLNKGSGVNAVDLIVKIRMSKAAALIIEKRYSLQEIAEMVGYNDVRSLRKHFISQFGALPSRFLEEK